MLSSPGAVVAPHGGPVTFSASTAQLPNGALMGFGGIGTPLGTLAVNTQAPPIRITYECTGNGLFPISAPLCFPVGAKGSASSGLAWGSALSPPPPSAAALPARQDTTRIEGTLAVGGPGTAPRAASMRIFLLYFGTRWGAAYTYLTCTQGDDVCACYTLLSYFLHVPNGTMSVHVILPYTRVPARGGSPLAHLYWRGLRRFESRRLLNLRPCAPSNGTVISLTSF